MTFDRMGKTTNNTGSERGTEWQTGARSLGRLNRRYTRNLAKTRERERERESAAPPCPDSLLRPPSLVSFRRGKTKVTDPAISDEEKASSPQHTGEKRKCCLLRTCCSLSFRATEPTQVSTRPQNADWNREGKSSERGN